MTNENDSNNPPAEPQGQPPPQSPMTPPAPTERKIGDDSKKSTDADQNTAKELAREFRWIEGAQLVINGVLAIVGIIALLIYHGQLDVMRGQLGEIIKQYPEIKKSADANVTASKAATESLKTIGKQFQLDQRPFVIVTCCKAADITNGSDSTPTIGKPLDVTITVHNIGKSPAFNLKTYDHLLFGNDAFNIRADPETTERSEQMLPQGGPGIFMTAVSVKNTYTARMIDLDPSEVVNWDGNRPVIVFGRVTYDDTFGNHYCTPFIHWWLHDNTWAVAIDLAMRDKKTKRHLKMPHMCPEQTTF